MKITSTTSHIILVDSPLEPIEEDEILGDPNAMKAIIDGSGTIPPAKWLKFYTPSWVFCGGLAMLNILPSPLQVEYHLFYLSTAPKKFAREFSELAYIYALLHRLQPYTVIRATPQLQYMINYMRRLGMQEIPQHGRYFFIPPVDWQPKHIKGFEVDYSWE